MGNKLLGSIVLLAIPFLLFATNKYPDIDRLVEQVKTKRIGLGKEEIQKLKNPFIDERKLQKIVKKYSASRKKKKKELHLHLYSILNERVKINGKWYKKGSKVFGYRIVKIDVQNRRVVLVNAKRKLILFLYKRKKRRIKLIKM